MPSWPEMNPDSARALVWVPLVLIVVGPLATAHSAMFAFPALGALIALVPAVFASKRTRIGALVVLAIGVVISAANYPGYRAELDRYVARSRERNINAREQSVGTPEQRADAQAPLDKAEAQLANAEAQLANAEAQLDSANALRARAEGLRAGE